MVKQYELMVLLPSNFTQEQMKTFVTQLTKSVETKKGKILSNESLGKRQLAYMIKKQTEAFYMLFTLEMDTSVAQSFERDLLLMDDVLRELFIIKPEEVAIVPAPKADTMEDIE